MAKLVFTSHLRTVAPQGETAFDGATVREVLQNAFAESAHLKGYILDDQGRLRKHVCIFLDGVRLRPQEALDASVSDASEIYVMQALSGG